MTIVKKEIVNIVKLNDRVKKFVFEIVDDEKGGFVTDIHVDELHELLLPKGKDRKKVLEKSMLEIVDLRVEEWLKTATVDIEEEELKADDFVNKTNFLN